MSRRENDGGATEADGTRVLGAGLGNVDAENASFRPSPPRFAVTAVDAFVSSPPPLSLLLSSWRPMSRLSLPTVGRPIAADLSATDFSPPPPVPTVLMDRNCRSRRCHAVTEPRFGRCSELNRTAAVGRPVTAASDSGTADRRSRETYPPLGDRWINDGDGDASAEGGSGSGGL